MLFVNHQQRVPVLSRDALKTITAILFVPGHITWRGRCCKCFSVPTRTYGQHGLHACSLQVIALLR